MERRSATDAPSHFIDPAYRTFYRRLTEGLAPNGWLLFTILSLDDEPVAFHYGFVYERCLVWYKPSFTIRRAHLSPGEVLLAELVKYCRAHDLEELDFTIGDELFKERFSNVKRHNVRFRTFRNGVLQRADRLGRLLRTRARRLRDASRLADAGSRRAGARTDSNEEDITMKRSP